MIKKKYNIIYADPPWSYRVMQSVKREHGTAVSHYPTMSIDEISALPISEIADKDCTLFLWVTYPKLNEVFPVIEAWEFEYKTVAFTWVKTNRKSPGYYLGLGYWTRSNAEICLLATKGKPKRINRNVRQLIAAPISQHSRKPDETRTRIVELMGDLPRLELFAREKHEGWDVFGNEVKSDIIL